MRLKRLVGWMSLLGALACADSDSAEEPCNGHIELCDRPFNEVALASTHNSMSSAEMGWVAPNQQLGIARQLEDGIRGFLFDTHMWEGAPYLCHSACEWGNTPLVEGLTIFTDFLTANPREVLGFIIQDGMSVEEHVKAFEESGLIDYVYTHDPEVGWPTLGEMIESGQRLVVTAEGGGPPPAWFMHAWEIGWDTPYSFNSYEEFSCRLNRGSDTNDLFLVNHWLGTPIGLPDTTNAAETNRYERLYGRANLCMEEAGRIPNFVAVDFYAVGDLFRVVDRLNGFEVE